MKTCYVEKIVSKVIIIACDYLLVSKIPKRRGRNGDNRLFFPPKTMILTIMNKSPWDSNAIFIFFCYSGFPHKTVHPFRNFLADLSPPTLYKVEIRKKFWRNTSNIVCGVRGRFWAWGNWKMPQKCKSVPRLLSIIVA